MNSSPEKLKPHIAIICMAVGIIIACLYSVGVIISWLLTVGDLQRLGLCLLTYPMLVAWQQYVSVFRVSKRAAVVTATLAGVIGVPTTLLLLMTLPWYIKLAQNHPDSADWTGFTVFGVIATTGTAGAICNWIWYGQLKVAEEQGTATNPSEKFSLGELMWLVIAISFVLAVSSFWQRTFPVPLR